MADPKPISIPLADFPEHAAIIGDLLVGYGEIEFLMIALLSEALQEKPTGDDDLDTAVRVLYRLWGAKDRLSVADALIRPFADRLKLTGQYCQWVGAMRKCRLIRNQFAHCGWDNVDGRLHFANFSADVESPERPPQLRWEPIDLGLLKEQQAFFNYTRDVAIFLFDEIRFRKDRRRKHGTLLPKSRAAPSLHSPED